jgi:hypothetical protein
LISIPTVTELVFTADLSMEPAEHVIAEGVVTGMPIGRLQSGDSKDIELALCFLCFGRFDIRAEVRILGTDRNGSKAGTTQLIADVLADE